MGRLFTFSEERSGFRKKIPTFRISARNLTRTGSLEGLMGAEQK